MPFSPLTIFLFGPMQVRVGSEPLPRLRTRSVAWLLALLVLRHGRAISPTSLAGALWPDSAESQARLNLRHDRVPLRNAPEAEAARILAPDSRALRFDSTGAFVDTAAFDAAIQAGDESSLQRAVALYRGTLLADCDREWVAAERQRREQERLRALETLAEAALSRGDSDAALKLWQRAGAIDGFRDSAQRGLMRALEASGDTPAALMAYREYRIRLHREMNLEPDEETARLYRAMRQRAQQAARSEARAVSPPASGKGTQLAIPEFSLHKSLPARPAASLPHPLNALLGREAERREIGEAVRQHRLVILVGGGGLGKTRRTIQIARDLSEEFAEGAAFLELAGLTDGGLLPAHAMAALNLQENPETEADTALHLAYCVALAETAEAALSGPGQERAIAHDLMRRVDRDRAEGRPEEARQNLEEIARIWREVGNAPYLGDTLRSLSRLAFPREDRLSARRCLEEALAIFRQIGSPANISLISQELSALEEIGEAARGKRAERRE